MDYEDWYLYGISWYDESCLSLPNRHVWSSHRAFVFLSLIPTFASRWFSHGASPPSTQNKPRNPCIAYKHPSQASSSYNLGFLPPFSPTIQPPAPLLIIQFLFPPPHHKLPASCLLTTSPLQALTLDYGPPLTMLLTNETIS